MKQIPKEVYILRVSKVEEIYFFIILALLVMKKYIKCIFCEEDLPKERKKKLN